MATSSDGLPPALPGRREVIDTAAGRVSVYGSAEAEGMPLLLIHSINAAANAYEVRPLYLHAQGRRPVYALDLPGFGFSERSRRLYNPRVMADAIHAVADAIARRHGGVRIDAIALSLSASYLARAVVERPEAYRAIGLISPTGFDRRLSGRGPAGGDRGSPRVRAIVDSRLLGPALFALLVSRPSMRFFLQKTFGSKRIDEGLFAYDYRSAHQPGARHAPYCFVAGHLFPTDATTLYEALTLPVLMLHGSRGDFVDFRDAPRFAARPNWTIRALPTGAFPHFEDPATVTGLFDGFFAGLA
ncbi:alpha/beta hydrolase [Methylobacterium sp. E-016]|uniref:alpha/beta fold hydrolase n=1 Tax=Methylobacterium sp. E-016 TaxID=2836556 RepID=UPI001FB94C3E|nr:alpha/beta hydrolase [Methylobacterium sp. E-016]MCJ2077496.1 alpha/beta hydrolase [Methylobacterium sp. E-016]